MPLTPRLAGPLHNMQTSYKQVTWFFAVLLFLVIVGFWPTYFSVLASARTSIHIHGALMLLWMGALIAQVWFIRSGRVELHRVVGKVSFFLAPLIVLAGLTVSHESLAEYTGNLPPTAMQTLTLPLIAIVQFAVTYTLAIYYRRDANTHARYMISTGIILVHAGTIRIFLHYVPGFGALPRAANASFLLWEIVALALIANDVRQGKLRGPFIVFLAIFGLHHILFWTAADMAWWQAVAEAIR